MIIQLNANYSLRPFKKDDANAIAKYANNKKIADNLRDMFPHPYTYDDAVQWLEKILPQKNRAPFAIATSEELIGCIGLMVGEDVHRFLAELGYWLAEPFWNNGVMTLAVKAIVDYGFNTLQLNRIFAEPYESNPASGKVLENAGFVQEGILRSNVIKNGNVLNQTLYSIIPSDLR